MRETGTLHFSVEARILRELGERLVRRPETALTELIKNSYDADATQCRVEHRDDNLLIADNGSGMTLGVFQDAWMRIGTASKAATRHSATHRRAITGEKGIGRFSVRFLGDRLDLISVADDDERGTRTRLTASFHWPTFDASEDIGEVEVPYELVSVPTTTHTGTELTIGQLRPAALELDSRKVRSGSIGLVSPLRSMIAQADAGRGTSDPGFRLIIGGDAATDENDVALPVLNAFFLQATLTVRDRRLTLKIFERGHSDPELEIVDTVQGQCGQVDADIRFYPRRRGAFRDLGVDGRTAYSWIKDNAGVAVFDRAFRVSPYGEPGDDWLDLAKDAARNERRPQSELGNKHLAMTDAERKSTTDNWMLRLPQPSQLVGIVQVAGTADGQRSGLVAAADREGFLANEGFSELKDHVRGAVEAMAAVDRRLQRRNEERARTEHLSKLRFEAEEAARVIEQNTTLPAEDRARFVQAVFRIAEDATAHEAATKERVRQLEVMSLLGVVAGFMTHEFGVAVSELDAAHLTITEAAAALPGVAVDLARYHSARQRLDEFVEYSTAYISGSRRVSPSGFTVRPRIQHVHQTFGAYAFERGVHVEIDVADKLPAPPVPTSLYDGIVMNLFTNALKAVTAAADHDNERLIHFRAWNEKTMHILEVCDTGIGIPEVLWERVFDPLFTTTESSDDPLGSGMGLGLSLVRASTEAFDGKVELLAAPPGFATRVRVQLPLELAKE